MVIVVFVHEITVEMCMHRVIGGISNGEADELKLEISFIASNEVARVRIVEGPHLKPRWENSDVLIPFDLCKEPTVETTSTTSTVSIFYMSLHLHKRLTCVWYLYMQTMTMDSQTYVVLACEPFSRG